MVALIVGTVLAGCGPGPSQRGAPQADRTAATGTTGAPGQRIARLPGPGTPVTPTEMAKVAFLVPLSGANAKLGRAMLNAAELAVEDIASDTFALLPKDTGGTPERAAAAAREAVAEGAGLILGPLLAPSVEAVRSVARDANINVISFSSDETVAGGRVFVMGFLPRDQVDQVVRFAIAAGRARIAVLAPDTPYGRLVAEATEAAARDTGGAVTKVAFYDREAADVTPTVRAFANYDSRSEDERKAGEGLDFDAVMLPEGGIKLLQVAPLLPFFDVDPSKVLYLGTGQWDSPVVRREPNLVGALFAGPPPEARTSFVAAYRQTFGETPSRLTTLAYDATALAAVLANTPGGADFSEEAITAPNGFTGTDGLMRFRSDGTVERGLAVLRIEKDGFSTVNPARNTFETAIN